MSEMNKEKVIDMGVQSEPEENQGAKKETLSDLWAKHGDTIKDLAEECLVELVRIGVVGFLGYRFGMEKEKRIQEVGYQISIGEGLIQLMDGDGHPVHSVKEWGYIVDNHFKTKRKR